MRDTINGRPLSVVGYLTALHSVVYGLGFIFLFGGFEKTALHENLNNAANANLFGWAILVSGILTAFGLALRHEKTIAIFSGLQSFAWAFTFFLYGFKGEWFLGIGTALVWALMSSYVAYVHANKEVVLGSALKLYKNDNL